MRQTNQHFPRADDNLTDPFGQKLGLDRSSSRRARSPTLPEYMDPARPSIRDILRGFTFDEVMSGLAYVFVMVVAFMALVVFG